MNIHISIQIYRFWEQFGLFPYAVDLLNRVLIVDIYAIGTAARERKPIGRVWHMCDDNDRVARIDWNLNQPTRCNWNGT